MGKPKRRSISRVATCEGCREHKLLRLCRAATAYADEARNKSLWFCADCERDYYEYWTER